MGTNRILDLYSRLHEIHLSGTRFIDEIFYGDTYSASCPRLNIIDLGAFEGEFSYYCLPFANKIYAIEPDPAPYEKMVKLVKEFELEDKIFTYPIAISGQNGTRNFHASGGGGSSLMAPNSAEDQSIKVETLTLNTFLQNEGIESVDILKIDVESSEKEIFTSEDFEAAVKKIKYIIGEDHGGGGYFKILEKWYDVSSIESTTVWEAKRK